MAYFFEDDARLFESKFCDASHRASFWKQAPADTFLAILGGHNFKASEQTDPWSLPTSALPSGVEPLSRSFGTYGFAVPRSNLQALHDGYQKDIATGGYILNGKVEEAISPDICFYNFALQHQQTIYAASPLIVKHVAGWSNTWGKDRGEIAATNALSTEGTVEHNAKQERTGEGQAKVTSLLSLPRLLPTPLQGLVAGYNPAAAVKSAEILAGTAASSVANILGFGGGDGGSQDQQDANHDSMNSVVVHADASTASPQHRSGHHHKKKDRHYERGYFDGGEFISTQLRGGKCQGKARTWAQGYKEGYFMNYDTCPVSALAQLNLTTDGLSISADKHTSRKGQLAFFQALQLQKESSQHTTDGVLMGTAHTTPKPRLPPQHPSAEEILQQTVFVVKTFNRPGCLRALLQSVAKLAPQNFPVIIADDSNTNNRELANSIAGLNIVLYLRLDVDSGVGYGRNRLVAAVRHRDKQTHTLPNSLSTG